MNKTRVRFAPSPTGFVHIGSLRTALYDYLYARHTGGDFVLKIEDTDQKRFVEGAVENLIKSLGWCGLGWDEGVFQTAEIKDDKIPVYVSKNYKNIFEAGEYGPYIQSEKLEIYKKYAEQLVADGHAYYCFCGPERLEELRNQQAADKKPPMYDRYCLRNISPEEVNEKLKENCPYVIRLKIPENETIEFEDMVRGIVKFDTNLVDDQVLMKSDGFPTYHLANVIDDYDMKITHVIRGEEWLSSTPKHLLLYRYFGWEAPKFAHLPLLLNLDRSKLSKRQGDVAVEDYIKKGYLKEAIINFVALLGWNPGSGETQEIFTLDELVDKFDFSHVHKGGAVFDIKKLDWINSQWIKKISLDDLYQRAKEFFEQKDFYTNASEDKKTEEYMKKVLTVERERLQKLSEVGEGNGFFFTDIDYDKELLRWKGLEDEKIRESLDASGKIMENITHENWTRENLEKNLMAAAEKYSNADGKPDRGRLLWPLRAALTGEKKSPSPFEAAWVLGKDKSLKRIKDALEKI
ncbi:MAG: glutamate--tRNA ligase [Candidatus Pacebacteria bacterium]|nr:glutamate--tRNA ligase [Candidatus Paceibacterota bacterium]